MTLLVDTSVLVDYHRGGSALEELTTAEPSAISVITVSELLQGVLRAPASRRARNAADVERILDVYDPVPVTEPVARVHAVVWAQLVESGVAIDAHDLWIGATALTHGFGVATLNRRHFDLIPELRVVAPSA